MSNIPSDHLFQLVKSLTKPEKRYFKVFSSRHVIGDINNYLVLFDAIDKMTQYDETLLLKKFKNKPFTKRFSISKNRLYNAIVKSLDSFHSCSSIDAQLHRQMHVAEILYKKGLYQQSMKQLQSARKVAISRERYSILAEISRWEKRIVEKDSYESLTSEKALDKILQEDRQLTADIQAYNELWYVKSKIFNALYKEGKVRSATEVAHLKKTIEYANAIISESQRSIENTYLMNHLQSAYCFATADYTACYTWLNNNLKLIEGKPHLFDHEPNIYLSVLTNCIYVCQRLGKLKEAEAHINKLNALLKSERDNEDQELRLFTLAKSTELTLYTQQGNFEKALSLEPQIEEGLKRFDSQISSIRKAHFYFNLAVAHFGLEQYHEALRWINLLLNNVAIDKTKDIHCMAQIFNLVIHMELGHTDLLPYALRSTQRFLATRKKVFRFEKIMLDFVNEMLKKRRTHEDEELFAILSESLRQLRKDSFECTVFEYFDFMAWAQSKLHGKKYRELLAA